MTIRVSIAILAASLVSSDGCAGALAWPDGGNVRGWTALAGRIDREK
jgi:hypothetical protein